VISEVVHDFLALIFDFLSTESADKGRTLVLDCLRHQSVIVEVGDLKLPDRLDCGWKEI
jgi:hypothetical protein